MTNDHCYLCFKVAMWECYVFCTVSPSLSVPSWNTPHPHNEDKDIKDNSNEDNNKEDNYKEDIDNEDFWIIKEFLAPSRCIPVDHDQQDGGLSLRGWASGDLAVLQKFLIPRLGWLDHQRPGVIDRLVPELVVRLLETLIAWQQLGRTLRRPTLR